MHREALECEWPRRPLWEAGAAALIARSALRMRVYAC